MIRLLTRQMVLDGIVARWKEQYFSTDKQWSWVLGGSGETIYNRLVALAPTADRADFDAAIGNSSWTRLECDGCDADVDAVVMIRPEEGEYDDYPRALCRPCTSRATSLFVSPPPLPRPKTMTPT